MKKYLNMTNYFTWDYSWNINVTLTELYIRIEYDHNAPLKTNKYDLPL